MYFAICFLVIQLNLAISGGIRDGNWYKKGLAIEIKADTF